MRHLIVVLLLLCSVVSSSRATDEKYEEEGKKMSSISVFIKNSYKDETLWIEEINPGTGFAISDANYSVNDIFPFGASKAMRFNVSSTTLPEEKEKLEPVIKWMMPENPHSVKMDVSGMPYVKVSNMNKMNDPSSNLYRSVTFYFKPSDTSVTDFIERNGLNHYGLGYYKYGVIQNA